MRRNFSQIHLPSKLDLDALFAAFLWDIDPDVAGIADKIKFIAGSSSGSDLSDINVLCIETGGTGLWRSFCFDHHTSGISTETIPDFANQCASVQVAQFFQDQYGHALPPHLKDVLQYVNAIDYGRDVAGFRQPLPRVPFPRLLDILNGMLLVERVSSDNPREGLLEILRASRRIFSAVLQWGVNPMQESVENILWRIPRGIEYLNAKKRAVGEFEAAPLELYHSRSGLSVGVTSSNNIGLPKNLYEKYGIDAVIALCPEFEVRNDVRTWTVPKYTISLSGDTHKAGYDVLGLLTKLQEFELRLRSNEWEGNEVGRGWGHPNNNTSMLCSDRYSGSILAIELVTKVVLELM